MKVRLSLALSLAAASPALAQPAPKQQLAAAEAGDFEKNLDALFSLGGLSADQAASQAAKVSPSLRRKAAEVEVSIAQLPAAALVRVPRVEAKAGYTRVSPIDGVPLGPGVTLEFPVNY